VAGAPGTVSDTARETPRPAPRLGAHTEEVLLEFMGLGTGALGALVDMGIVATADEGSQ
jgi:2-methylfumaryl-CoA isomerase